MKRGIAYLLGMAILLLPALAKKEKKIDPRLKSIHTIYVQGKEESCVKNARESLANAKCFQLTPNAETADAVMSVTLSSETQSYAPPSPGGGVGGQSLPITNSQKTNRSTLTLKIHEGTKMKKVWSDDINLSDSEEVRKSGVRRLIEKLGEEVCSQR